VYAVDVARREKRRVAWDARGVHALRDHLSLTQEQMAEELGTRQQTISEWETGQYQPRGASARLLTLIAERAGFAYGAAPGHKADDKSEG
jgi:DNA-binding transcriptional regulator YiaG